MEALKIQIRCYLNKNKLYMILFLLYMAVMIGIMANMQTEVPFANVQNFFYNNHIIINILMLQGIILVLNFFRNNISYMAEQGVSKGKAYIGNIVNSILFSIISSIFIVGVFCITIIVASGNSSVIKGIDIYYFGLEIYGINLHSFVKMVLFTFAAFMMVMAICNLLALGSRIWTFAFGSMLTILFAVSIWKKSFIVTAVSHFFQWYKAPYYLSLILVITAIVLFLLGWFFVRKISINIKQKLD